MIAYQDDKSMTKRAGKVQPLSVLSRPLALSNSTAPSIPA
jgi:hypothetical protein